MQPFSIVHDQGFKNFVQLLNPSYQLPSRKYISNTLLPALYEEKYNCVQKLVSDIQSATLTTDCWTSMNTESFIAVTVHFISEDLQAKSVLLECCSFPKAHTSVNLVTELNRIVTLWELESKILLAVKNNAANIKRAVKEDLSWKHFGCYAHTINLVVQDGLKLVSPVLTKVRALVAHFKRSTTTSGKLMDIQRQAGKEPKKLLQDVEARWNSTFYMLDRILDMEEVRTVMALLNVNNLPVVLVEGWAFLRQLRKCLKPMEEITKIISGQKYVTLSSVIILTKGLENIYRGMDKESVMEVENSKTLLVFTFIDPRFKNVGFSCARVAERAKQLVISLVVQKINELTFKTKEIQVPPDCITTETDTALRNSSEETPSIWGQFEKQAGSLSFKTTAPATFKAITEVQLYLEQELLERDGDPLKWWRDHSSNYPNLSKVVIEKFGTVATSVPCERVFSKSGQLISERRSRISSSKVEKLMFLNVNSEL
nr:unnamed protein product [Callosobruchus analis]